MSPKVKSSLPLICCRCRRDAGLATIINLKIYCAKCAGIEQGMRDKNGRLREVKIAPQTSTEIVPSNATIGKGGDGSGNVSLSTPRKRKGKVQDARIHTEGD